MFSQYDISRYEFLLSLSANKISRPKFSHIESSFSALVLVLALGVLALLEEKKGGKLLRALFWLQNLYSFFCSSDWWLLTPVKTIQVRAVSNNTPSRKKHLTQSRSQGQARNDSNLQQVWFAAIETVRTLFTTRVQDSECANTALFKSCPITHVL